MSIRDADLHASFKRLLAALQPEAGHVQMILDSLKEAWAERRRNADETGTAVWREIQELVKKRSRLVDLIAEDKINADSVRANIQEYEIEIAAKQASFDEV